MKKKNLSRLIKSLNFNELKAIRMALLESNSKFGDKNRYLHILDIFEKGDPESTDFLRRESLEKAYERLFIKVHEVLSLSYNLNKIQFDSIQVKERVLISKYLNLALLAKGRNDEESFEFLMKRGIKAARRAFDVNFEAFLLEELSIYYSQRRKTRKKLKLGLRLNRLKVESQEYKYLASRLAKFHSIYHSRENQQVTIDDQEKLIELFRKGSSNIRLRRLQLFSIISLIGITDPILSDLKSKKDILHATKELDSLIPLHPELFHPFDKYSKDLNLALLQLYIGEISETRKILKRFLKFSKSYPYQYNIALKYYAFLNLYSADPINTSSSEDPLINEEILLSKAAENLLNSKSGLHYLSKIESLYHANYRFKFYINIYTALSAVVNDDLDFADTIVTQLVRNRKKYSQENQFNITINLFKEWRETGFIVETSDLPAEVVEPVKYHYENTWNPLSPDLIPLHLWRKKEGIPNYKDAYAHLFACKRKLAQQQGFSLD